MKKIFSFLVSILLLSANFPAYAHHCSSHAYVTHKDYFQEEQVFANCNKHSILKETTVYFYSNGTRRTYVTSTIYNSDGSVLESGCLDVKHIVYKNKHYFTFYKNKKYQIIDEFGTLLSIKNYKKMYEIGTNRFLVKLDKKYGIIDLNEKIVVPIKYKEFKQVGKNLFLTKLNGYYGMLDSENNIILRNEYDKIKPLYDTFLLKKYDKYGLADMHGKLIVLPNSDSIKKLGEYIVVQQGKYYNVYNSNGEIISNVNYKKIRLNRNILEGKVTNKNWEEIN